MYLKTHVVGRRKGKIGACNSFAIFISQFVFFSAKENGRILIYWLDNKKASLALEALTATFTQEISIISMVTVHDS